MLKCHFFFFISDDIHNIDLWGTHGPESDVHLFGVNNIPLFRTEENRDSYKNVFTEVFDRPIRSKIGGCFIMNGDIVIIPYLMDNNRENIHLYKDRLNHEFWRFFLYSKTNRGYKFNYDVLQKKFIARDCHGIDYVETLPVVDLKSEFDISPKHILWTSDWMK